MLIRCLAIVFCGCWCCLLALARCHNWVIFPCTDRERQGKRYNRRAILRWSRHLHAVGDAGICR